MINGNQPAHPDYVTMNFNNGRGDNKVVFKGLTKREYFAIEALKGILSNSSNNDTDIMGVNGSVEKGFIACNMSVREAIRYADELLNQLTPAPSK